jgi:hypothetical protein
VRYLNKNLFRGVIKMSKCRILDYNSIPRERRLAFDFDDDYLDIPEMFLLEKDKVEIGSPIERNGKLYALHMIVQNKKYALASEHEIPEWDSAEERYGDEITCPYCGDVKSDSWEKSDESDDEYCYVCGGTYSYQRIVTVEYESTPVRKGELIRA